MLEMSKMRIARISPLNLNLEGELEVLPFCYMKLKSIELEGPACGEVDELIT